VTEDKPIELKLEDEDALLERATAGKALPKGAYNPYDVDPRAVRTPKTGAGARTDLRKLSEWIKLKREIEELKAEEERTAEQGQAAPRARSKK